MATPKIEANLGGSWVDVTADDLGASFKVRRRMRVESGVQIIRGRPDQFTTVAPGRCQFELNNQDGKYSPRNPLSDYFGQLGRNTPIRVGVDPMADTFTRSVTDGWGTSSSGHAWTIVSGTAANFDVAAGVGTVVSNNVVEHVAVLPGSYGHVDCLVKARASSIAGTPRFGIVANWQSTSNYIGVLLDRVLGMLRIIRVSGGGTVDLDQVSFTIAASTDYWIRLSSGPRIRAKAWQDGSAEPAAWTLDAWDEDFSTNHPLEKFGRVGVYADAFNVGTVLTFDSLTVDSWRFHGEVKSWPQRWDRSGNDVSTLVEASGILDRLTTNTQAPLQSPMYREATKDSVTDFIAAYWPCEDGANATQLASALTNAPPITFVGPVNGAQSDAIPGSKPLAVFGTDGNISGYVPSTVDTNGKVYFRIILDVPESPSTADGANILNIYVTGSFIRCALIYNTASSGSLEARAVAADQTTLESASLGGNLNGTRLYLSIELVQSGSDISFLAARNEISDDNTTVTSSVFTDTWSSMTVGSCYRISAGSMEGWGFGHIGVGNDQHFMFSMADALIGNSGETAGNRAIRVAEESGIALQVVGDPDDSPLMGPQIQGAALDVLRSCEAADGGVLYESRNELGLTLRLLSSMVNQDGPTLDYDDGHINTIEPDDEQNVYNDVTATRLDGSAVRRTLDAGALSTLDPPDGAGRLAAPDISVNVESDLQLPDIASWNLHLYTWDEQRFRTLGVQHGAPALQADADLRAQLAALDTGDMFTVENPPSWLPQDDIRQLVQGYTEVIGPAGADLWEIDWNTTPYGPYQVGVWGSETDPDADDTETRYDGMAHFTELGADITSGSTSVSVATSKGPLWTTDADDMPFNLRIGPPTGEVVTVTAVSGSSSPQTFTVTRGVNGIQKPWSAGTDVELADSTVWAL